MTREEIDNVIREIREYCMNTNCENCDAHTSNGCIFMSSYPMEWLTIEEAEKEE